MEYKAPKLRLKKVKMPKGSKPKKEKEERYEVGSGTGKTKLAKISIKPKKKAKKKPGKFQYYKSPGKEEMNLIDARAMTREAAKEGLKYRTEKGRLEYERKLQKMIKKMK